MLKFVNWDWRPAVFETETRRAAAVLEGATCWSEVDAEDVIHTGAPLTDQRFKDTFGELPPLPSWLNVPNRSEAELNRIRALEEEERRLYSDALARLGPEWGAVLKEAANGGRTPKVSLKVNRTPRAIRTASTPDETTAERRTPSASPIPTKYNVRCVINGSIAVIETSDILGWAEGAGYTFVGPNEKNKHRPELRGLPVFAGVAGPWSEGNTIWYETAQAWDRANDS